MGMQLSIWNLHVQSIIHREFYHDSVYIANEGHYISTEQTKLDFGQRDVNKTQRTMILYVILYTSEYVNVNGTLYIYFS
jgi:hypothetical protein